MFEDEAEQILGEDMGRFSSIMQPDNKVRNCRG